MGLFRRRTTDGRAADQIDERDGRRERTGTRPGLVRALFTLVGVVAAALLIWIASTVAGALDQASTGEYWAAMALIAGAGLALGLSQLFGGWTKWGWPTMSATVFLFGFLPTLILGGWIALAKQPHAGVEEGRFDRWSDDLGISGFVDDIGTYLSAIALIVGLVLAFSFDTTGPRSRVVTRERSIPDEDVHDYRTETPAGTTTRPATTVAEDLRTRGSGSEGVPAGVERPGERRTR